MYTEKYLFDIDMRRKYIGASIALWAVDVGADASVLIPIFA